MLHKTLFLLSEHAAVYLLSVKNSADWSHFCLLSLQLRKTKTYS